MDAVLILSQLQARVAACVLPNASPAVASCVIFNPDFPDETAKSEFDENRRFALIINEGRHFENEFRGHVLVSQPSLNITLWISDSTWQPSGSPPPLDEGIMQVVDSLATFVMGRWHEGFVITVEGVERMTPNDGGHAAKIQPRLLYRMSLVAHEQDDERRIARGHDVPLP